MHSGAYDRASYALSLALVALAMGCEVHMLLTYGGLLRFTKGRLEKIGEETPEPERRIVEHGLSTGGIEPLGKYLDNARKLGLRLYACANAMAVMNISRAQLVSEVDEVTGLAAFMRLAQEADINWYI